MFHLFQYDFEEEQTNNLFCESCTLSKYLSINFTLSHAPNSMIQYLSLSQEDVQEVNINIDASITGHRRGRVIIFSLPALCPREKSFRCPSAGRRVNLRAIWYILRKEKTLSLMVKLNPAIAYAQEGHSSVTRISYALLVFDIQRTVHRDIFLQ